MAEWGRHWFVDHSLVVRGVVETKVECLVDDLLYLVLIDVFVDYLWLILHNLLSDPLGTARSMGNHNLLGEILVTRVHVLYLFLLLVLAFLVLLGL